MTGSGLPMLSVDNTIETPYPFMYMRKLWSKCDDDLLTKTGELKGIVEYINAS